MDAVRRRGGVWAAVFVLALLLGAGFGRWGAQAAPERPALAKTCIFGLPVSSTATILTSNLACGNVSWQRTVFRVTVGLTGTDAAMYVMFTDGTTTEAFALNKAVMLVAGNLYAFSFGCDHNLEINFTFGNSTNIGVLLVEEVQEGQL